MDVSIVIISKDERDLATTLDALAAHASTHRTEILVVDASRGRLAELAEARPRVRWMDFVPPEPGLSVSGRVKTITIPEQRNAGIAAARGEVIVFVDAGCLPDVGWLDALLGPIERGEERLCVGGRYGADGRYLLRPERAGYVRDAPTLNMAVHRDAIARVGPFDERFSYGSDVDFCWRAADAGIPVLMVPGADMQVNWGGTRRQLGRGWQYGDARARLYVKHRSRLRQLPRHDPMLLAYPLFLLGLPIALRRRSYLLLLCVPLYRNRHQRPLLTLVDHLAYGAGALSHVARRARRVGRS